MPTTLRSIIIVDDDSDDALFTQRLIEKAGILNPVFVLCGGEEAIAHLQGLCESEIGEHELPCAVFLDVKMPRVTGHQVLEWTRQQARLSDVKIVMLSSSDDPRDIARAKKLGADSYLVKHPPAENFRKFINEVPCIVTPERSSATAD